MADFLNRSCEIITEIVSLDQDLATLDNMYSSQCRARVSDKLSEIVSSIQKLKTEIASLKKEDYRKV